MRAIVVIEAIDRPAGPSPATTHRVSLGPLEASLLAVSRRRPGPKVASRAAGHPAEAGRRHLLTAAVARGGRNPPARSIRKQNGRR